ncbi:MAG: DUF1837 domain-containing protein [Alphaproteobacteria bacterium]|nr:DUF1837 domain-containing protein [Alphaproteobacteria bacterium]
MTIFNSEIIIKENHKLKDFKSYYVGYINNQYDWDSLLDVMMKALIEYVYGCSRCVFDAKNIKITFQKAINRLIKDKNYELKRTGDVGELLLHIILRDFFGTLPLVQKVHFKSSDEDAAKGFDIVHIKEINGILNLVLGEAKLHKDSGTGLTDLLNDIKEHYNSCFLQKEFVIISEQIEDHTLLPKNISKSYDEVREKFNKIMPDIIKAQKSNAHLDTVFDDTMLVLFCAFKADTCKKYKEVTEEFIEEINQHLEDVYNSFKKRNKCKLGNIVFVLFPLIDHDELISRFLDKMKDEYGKI